MQVEGLIQNSWLLGWFIYVIWMNACGRFYNVAAFLTAAIGGNWFQIYVNQ